MAQEPKIAKPGAKKSPAENSTKPVSGDKLDSEPAESSGKIIRKDAPATGSTVPFGGATVGFEEPVDGEAAAEDILLGDDATAENPTQGFLGETIDTEMPKAAPPQEDDPPLGSTQSFVGETLQSVLPRLIAEEGPLDNNTGDFTNPSIDCETPKEPAKRPSTPARKPAKSAGPVIAGARKGSAMAPSMLAGKYKLQKKLGQGGMGAVYKAHDVKLDRIVAVKVLAKELSSKQAYVDRFAREGRVMVKLDHPNVIRCFDIDHDEEKDLYFLAIEFVEGGSVEGWLKKLGKFSVGDALHLILKTAAGLQHAHERTLIHRDVKPDNILLTKDGIVKVADLGLAKDTNDEVSLTKTGAGAGTPIYMAPEQARDVKHVDCRCDIYALGIMMYVFLTGQPPFQGATLVELISAKEKGKYDTMRKHNGEVPGKLDLIVDKMIAKDLKDRYASCQEVIDAIEPLGLANEQLSFIEVDGVAAPAQKSPGQKLASTKGPAAVSPKTSVGNKGPAAKTSGPAAVPEQTAIPDGEDEPDRDVWYWKLVTPNGKSVTKKLSTEQVRTLIKSGHLDPTAEISKSEHSGFRTAATYSEFQSIFKSLKTATKANVKGAKYRSKMQELADEDERRRKYGWISRMFKSFGSTLFGLLWIVIILALVGGAAYFGYTQFIAK